MRAWLAEFSRELEEAPVEQLEDVAADLERARVMIIRRITQASSQPTNRDGGRYLTAQEVAVRLNLLDGKQRPNTAYIYELGRRGELPSVRIGEKLVRFPEDGIQEYLRQRTR